MRKHSLTPVHSACNIHASKSSKHILPKIKHYFPTVIKHNEHISPYNERSRMFTNKHIKSPYTNAKNLFLKKSNSSMSIYTNETEPFNYLNNKHKKHLHDDQINYFYYKIFKNKGIFHNRKKDLYYMNNLLNINYAENEEQFQLKQNKYEEKLRLKGQNPHIRHSSKVIESKLSECQDKILFMKGIVNYSYPRIVVTKTKVIEKDINKNYTTKGRNYLSPVCLRNIEINNKKKEREMYLQTPIKIISNV